MIMDRTKIFLKSSVMSIEKDEFSVYVHLTFFLLIDFITNKKIKPMQM